MSERDTWDKDSRFVRVAPDHRVADAHPLKVIGHSKRYSLLPLVPHKAVAEVSR